MDREPSATNPNIDDEHQPEEVTILERRSEAPQQIDQGNWDTSPEVVDGRIKAFEDDLAMSEEAMASASDEYEKERQKLADQIAKNEAALEAQRIIAVQIVKELTVEQQIDPDHTARKIAMLGDSLSAITEFDSANDGLRIAMERVAGDYAQRLHTEQQEIDHLNANFSDYFAAARRANANSRTTDLIQKIDQAETHFATVKKSLIDKIEITLPAAAQVHDNLKEKNANLKHAALHGMQLIAEITSDKSGITDDIVHKLASSLADIANSLHSSSITVDHSDNFETTPADAHAEN